MTASQINWQQSIEVEAERQKPDHPHLQHTTGQESVGDTTFYGDDADDTEKYERLWKLNAGYDIHNDGTRGRSDHHVDRSVRAKKELTESVGCQLKFSHTVISTATERVSTDSPKELNFLGGDVRLMYVLSHLLRAANENGEILRADFDVLNQMMKKNDITDSNLATVGGAIESR